MDLSIVIVNWNTWNYLQEAIRTVQKTIQNISYEILVVDNGSNPEDGITQIAELFPDVQLLQSEKNLGFSKANNRALQKATGNYLLLLNADTFQVENAIEQAVDYMQKRKDVGVLGIRHINAKKSPQASWHSFPSYLTDLKGLLGFPSQMIYDQDDLSEHDVDWVCGSFFLISRNCFEKVGDLDERYFIYDEDIDYCQRVWKAGLKVRYWGGVHFVHVGSGSGPRIRDKVYSNIRSRLTYYSQHLSPIHGFVFYIVVALKWGIGTLRSLLKSETKEELQKRWNRWRSWIFLKSSEEGIGSGSIS